MEFNKIRKQKKPNYTRAIILILLLLLAIYLWFNTEDLTKQLFSK